MTVTRKMARRPKRRTAKLTFDVGGDRYRVLALEPGDRLFACLLRKDDRAGTTYTLAVSAEGEVSCSCPDFHYRRRPKGEACKHLALLAGAGRFLAPLAARIALTNT